MFGRPIIIITSLLDWFLSLTFMAFASVELLLTINRSVAHASGRLWEVMGWEQPSLHSRQPLLSLRQYRDERLSPVLPWRRRPLDPFDKESILFLSTAISIPGRGFQRSRDSLLRLHNMPQRFRA